ncbi:hypothetical protein IscW_ISCW003678 [Ixodes scapularis]|uniref:Reverse transcriptase n=1 Tax=Ixodes scapularis TaxID=6945 RepID=B7PF07_IXOSC|nr:hypothetical protein IscW_ISCW003678 [Ixodes scapularis]|eukprot:XP_002433779.1 hypothetical protein IscW_ISCW003678 [Ixodes scapularis]
MQELALALQSINERSAPGKDGITWRMPCNLYEPEKRQLLTELNTVRASASLPDDWKDFVVHPIPKAGKNPDRVQNLHPISLISTLCKFL